MDVIYKLVLVKTNLTDADMVVCHKRVTKIHHNTFVNLLFRNQDKSAA